ncbi:MAG TPA: tetratricopeptide repeat protein [Anaerolineales bacterium]|nr:tetratricopeptide repeat protein [Anaerolineales bacterium]
MNVRPRRHLFYQKKRSNLYRSFLWVFLILAGIWLINQVEIGAIQRPFQPTFTPTRSTISYTSEGDASFTAGQLEEAISAYKEATNVDPDDIEVWVKLARIQVYSSNLVTTDAQRIQRLQDALESIDKAIVLAPDDSTVHATKAFVMDWLWSATLLAGQDPKTMLAEAEQEATRALQLDGQNVLAMAYYAEIMVDQQKWSQAEKIIIQAIERGPEIMDVHRVYAYVLESTSNYNQAIEEYQKAIEINPNLTFLYISVGANYRRLAFSSTIPLERDDLYDKALEYFAKAARLNTQLQILDPIPYISIAKTYSQKGDFFAAALNIKKALSFDISNADIHGQLGIIYFKSRNYEGSIPALKCAVQGCTAAESCEARFGRECAQGETSSDVIGLPLSNSTVVYYYTYGSVLAALSLPQRNYCPEAVQVLKQVRADFSSDETIIGIVSAGEQICASLNQDLLQTPTPLPTSTPVPTPRS